MEPKKNGMKLVVAPTWPIFTTFVSETFLEARNYIYRGQASPDWLLESSLDRLVRRAGVMASAKTRTEHLERFRFAIRGRRGANPPRLEGENDWWALGQHHGLATPLLDWTESPYVAAFFAFASEPDPTVERRVVFALSRTATRKKSKALRDTLGAEAPAIDFFRPLSDENPRLLSQGGIFTRTPDGVDVESWVRTHLADYPKVALYRIEIPVTERLAFLRNLNRMNINHSSLFPDLHGACQYCNYDLEIAKY